VTTSGQQEFVRALEQDPFRNTRDDDLLTGLRARTFSWSSSRAADARPSTFP
jgi:hypothetical protein